MLYRLKERVNIDTDQDSSSLPLEQRSGLKIHN
jgi:hypothetical protein